MGRVEKGVHCSVQGCENSAERSISSSKASMAGDLVINTSNKRAYLCRHSDVAFMEGSSMLERINVVCAEIF
jgi:hypothetical protein